MYARLVQPAAGLGPAGSRHPGRVRPIVGNHLVEYAFFPVGPDGGLSQETRSWLECPVELDDYSHPGKVALSFFDHYLDITWPLETAGRVRLTLSHKETAYQIEVRKSADGGYSVTWWEDEKDFDPFVIDPERFEQLP